jgi:exonuclease SbcC
MALNIPLNQFAKNKLSAPNLQDSEILLQLSDEWNHWRHGATQWRQLQQTIQALKTAQTQTRHNGTLLQQNYDVNSHELLKLSERQLITRNLLQTLSPNGNPKAEWQMLQERQLKLKSVADHDKDKLTALESKRERFKTTLSMLNEQVQSIEQMAIHYHATFENCYVELQTKTQTLAQEIVLLQKYWPAKMQAYNMPALSNKMPSLQQSDNGQHDFEQTILGLEIFINHYLSPQLNWIKTFYEFCQAQSHGLKSEHQRQIQLQQEWQVMLKAMEKMQHRYNSLRDLDHIIGKNDFRNWALAKIEEELINLANRELQQMCQGRYQLVQEIGKNGPEFLIEDLWSCSPPRKVSSLSGGETFLVSLAMAMALADMVRGQTYLESFFIDEGFGQLDPDGLEEAMSALWSIGQRGKTIGVISHIADLTNRIPVNIHVEKGARGHAHIEMIYH